MEEQKQYWLDDEKNVDKVFWGLCGLCLLILLPEFFTQKHPHYEWEGWFGFYGIYGFLSCIGLVLLAKHLRKILKRNDNYYER